MPSRVKEKTEADSEAPQLSERDIRLLVILCAELVNFCAKVTGKIDPAAGAMLAYVRDDIRFEGKSLLP
jgi:hypothetical protein